MKGQEIRIFSVLGLIFGAATTSYGLMTACECPVQLVGPPLDCSCAQSLSLFTVIGVLVIIFSAIGLTFSFLKPRTIQERGTAG